MGSLVHKIRKNTSTPRRYVRPDSCMAMGDYSKSEYMGNDDFES